MTPFADVDFDETRAPEPAPPPLSALWRGEAASWARHHLVERAQGAALTAAYRLCTRAGPERAAALGAALGGLAARRDRQRPYAATVREGIARIRPDLDPAAQEALAQRWWRECGATQAQFGLTEAFLGPERLDIEGEAHLDAIAAEPRPTFFLALHLANWEVVGGVLNRRFENRVFSTYDPAPSRHANRLVFELRARNGIHVFPRAPTLARRAVTLVRRGALPLFYVDETAEGRTRFPLFGRKYDPRCNLGFALRLAHRLGARLQPCHVARPTPGRLRLSFLEPVELDPEAPEAAATRRAARRLSARFEPRVAADLAQWYTLHTCRFGRGRSDQRDPSQR